MTTCQTSHPNCRRPFRASHRFGATRAYADIVEERISELREMLLSDYQRFGTSVDRRFRPAVRTWMATERRLQQLSANVAHLVDLLQTRVQVDLQEQNLRLLQGMDARTATQIKIQQAVEGLSIIAITYYAVGLVKLALDTVETAGLAHAKGWMIVAFPLTAIATVTAVLAVRRSLGHSGGR